VAVLQRRIGLKDIRSLKLGEIIWDGAVGGFHARRQQSKTVSYVVVYRTADGRQRWQAIGRHGSPWTPETAREAAKRILGHVADGADPAAEKHAKRKAASVAELCDLYLTDAEAGRLLTRRKAAKKASTIGTDKGRIERHIKPLLGSIKVAAVTREDVEAFMHAVAEGRTAARLRPRRSVGWLMCAVARAQQAAPSDCSALYSPMPCATG
jgi:Arm DNA-binding domain